MSTAPEIVDVYTSTKDGIESFKALLLARPQTVRPATVLKKHKKVRGKRSFINVESIHLGWARNWESSELFAIVETKQDADSDETVFECIPFRSCFKGHIFRKMAMEEVIQLHNVRKEHGEADQIAEIRTLLDLWRQRLDQATQAAQEEHKSADKKKKAKKPETTTETKWDESLSPAQKKEIAELRIQKLEQRLQRLESPSHPFAPGQPIVSDRVYNLYRRASMWYPAVRLWLFKLFKKHGEPTSRLKKHLPARFSADNEAFSQLPRAKDIFKLIMEKVLSTFAEDMESGIIDVELKRAGVKMPKVELGAKRGMSESRRLPESIADQVEEDQEAAAKAKAKRRRGTKTITKDKWDESESDSSSDSDDSDDE